MASPRKARSILGPVDYSPIRRPSPSRSRRGSRSRRAQAAQVRSLMSGIYRDLQYQSEGLVDPSWFPAHVVSQARRYLQGKSNDMMASRYGELAKENGWMMLSICAQAMTFRDASVEGYKVWSALQKLISDNFSSLEMFAKIRGIDWQSPLLATFEVDLHDVIEGINIGETMNLEPDHPQLYALKDGIPIRCQFNGQDQTNIEECTYDSADFPAKHPLARHQNKSCNNCDDLTGRCNCTYKDISEALVEIIDAGPPRNRGIRTLTDIKRDEYVGIYSGRIYVPEKHTGDRAYLFEHCKNDLVTRNVFIDSAIDGNWTRYINHSCNSNTISDQENLGKYSQIVICATRDIPAFTELTLDYGLMYFQDIVCACGEPNCNYGPPRASYV